jgi:hypothetical protein
MCGSVYDCMLICVNKYNLINKLKKVWKMKGNFSFSICFRVIVPSFCDGKSFLNQLLFCYIMVIKIYNENAPSVLDLGLSERIRSRKEFLITHNTVTFLCMIRIGS